MVRCSTTRFRANCCPNSEARGENERRYAWCFKTEMTDDGRRRETTTKLTVRIAAVRWRLRGRWLACEGLRNQTFQKHPIVTTEDRGEKVWSFMESEESKK